MNVTKSVFFSKIVQSLLSFPALLNIAGTQFKKFLHLVDNLTKLSNRYHFEYIHYSMTLIVDGYVRLMAFNHCFLQIATVFASENGLKVTVETAKCIQANAFLQSEVFQEYRLKENNISFQINLTILMVCIICDV